MSSVLRIVAVLAFIVTVMPSAAAAETAANPSLQKEVESFLAETPPSAPDTALKAFWKEGPRFETADGSFKLHLGGRVFWDNAWFGSDDYGRAETQDASYFRTIRLEADGTIFRNAFYKLQVDFAGGTVSVKDVYMGLKKLGAAGMFTAGHFKQPVSIEALTSSRFITFMERSAPTVAFAPEREDGLMLNNNFLADGMLGIFGSIYRYNTNDQGTVVDDGSYSLALRICAFFLHDKDLNRVLHVGFAYSYITAINDTLQFRARPDIGTGARFVDTGPFTANEQNLFNFEVAFLYKAFHVQAEAYLVECSGAGGPEPTFTGFYVEVGWFVVGGMRTYSTDKKVIERPEITQNFHAGQGGPGAWQLCFRYDTIDLTDSGIAGGVQDCFTVGANWYWNPQMRVMFNMIFADIRDGGPFGEGKLTIFGMRFQFDF